MMLVTAVFKPFKLDEVKGSLKEAGFMGFTVTEARGFGKQKGHAELYRGSEYVVDFLPKIVLTIAVQDGEVEQVVKSILEVAPTNRVGNGRIMVTRLEHFWHIGTGVDEAAEK